MTALFVLLALSLGLAAGRDIWKRGEAAPLPFCQECGRVLATWKAVQQHHEASHPDYGCKMMKVRNR